MRLLPADRERPSDFEDGAWIEKPGFPPIEGTWLHPSPGSLPEFEFEEGHERTRNEPPPRFVIGIHADATIRLPGPAVARKQCAVFKEGRLWFVESLSLRAGVWVGEERLEQGVPKQLRSGQRFSLAPPPTDMCYRIELDDDHNSYLDRDPERDFPNKWPAKMPGHASEAPPAPEELKRLAWQTDQMRRRSEEDQVKVADWAAFSQYVKKHYHKYGITAKPWEGSVGPPVPMPSLPGPRPLPSWIADLLVEERMLPRVDREYPFRESLALSGREPAPPLTPRASLPPGPASSWGQADAKQHKSGSAGLMGLDATLHAAARERGLLPPAAAAAAAGVPLSTGAPVPAVACPSPATAALLKHAAAASAPQSTATPLGEAVATSAASASDGERQQGIPPMKVTFKAWLQGMQDAEFVAKYHDALVAQFDSLEQVVELYVQQGVLDERFFDAVGIRKLGHRRLFQRWFREHCGS